MRIARRTATVFCRTRIQRNASTSPTRRVQVHLRLPGTTVRVCSRVRYRVMAPLKRFLLGHVPGEVIVTVPVGLRAVMDALHTTIACTSLLLELLCHITLPELHPKRWAAVRMAWTKLRIAIFREVIRPRPIEMVSCIFPARIAVRPWRRSGDATRMDIPSATHVVCNFSSDCRFFSLLPKAKKNGYHGTDSMGS